MPKKATNKLGKPITMTNVRELPVTALARHPLNDMLFRKPTNDETQNMIESVRTRGILTPLIVNNKNVILCGHTRIMIANHLKMPAVPARVIVDDLSIEEELAIMVSDNVDRRHDTRPERLKLYRTIFNDFDERVLIETRGLPVKGGLGLTSKTVAEVTGLDERVVRKDLAVLRSERKKSLRRTLGGRSVDVDAAAGIRGSLRKIAVTIGLMNKATAKSLVKDAEHFLRVVKDKASA